jgi:hypothetical protein
MVPQVPVIAQGVGGKRGGRYRWDEAEGRWEWDCTESTGDDEYTTFDDTFNDGFDNTIANIGGEPLTMMGSRGRTTRTRSPRTGSAPRVTTS